MTRSLKSLLVGAASAALMMLPASSASAAEANAVPAAAHCFPFIDHPVVCLVKCVAQNGTITGCDVQFSCNPDFPTVCYVMGEVVDLLP